MPRTFTLPDYEPPKPISRTPIFVFAVLVVLIILFGLGTSFIVRSLTVPSPNFPVDQAITISEGSNARAVAERFAEAGYVSSAWSLYVSLIWWYDPTAIKASTYIFSEPLSARALAGELTTGHFAHDLVSLTFKEGERARTIATTADAALPDFNVADFLALAEPVEGRLFPETYLVPKTFSANDLFLLLTKTYDERVHLPLFAETGSPTSLNEDEVLILASIIEREANTRESMKLVSGILQNRLSIGMPLQVDASMEYVLDKPLQALTPADLDTDTPYNTYLYPGLPPTPIGNPGIEAIRAVLEPTPSTYFYYITGNDGNFYYAETFDEHRANIARYLR